jgi:hypothetical protein
MTAAELTRRGWIWDDVNEWRHARYPGRTFSFRDAVKLEKA